MIQTLKTVKNISETAILSEASLAEDWKRMEEDEAWSHLQPEIRKIDMIIENIHPLNRIPKG